VSGLQQAVRRKKRLSGGSATYSAKDTSGGKWLPEEDERLRAGVEQLGAKNWKRISEEFLDKRRTDVQCLHRWQKVGSDAWVVVIVVWAFHPWLPHFGRHVRACDAVSLVAWCCAGAEAWPGQRPLDKGRRRHNCELHQRWRHEVVRNRRKNPRPHWQAVPGALVQSFGPKHQERGLVP
jgi:Myb-like DNA-binding domain